jgi:hypothetical protein
MSLQILDFLVVLFLGDDLEIGEHWLQNACSSRGAGQANRTWPRSVLSAEHAHVNQIGVLQDAERSKPGRPAEGKDVPAGTSPSNCLRNKTVSADLYVRPCQGMVFSGEGRDDEQQDS